MLKVLQEFNESAESFRSAFEARMEVYMTECQRASAMKFVEYMHREDNLVKIDHLMKELEVEIPQVDASAQTLTGKVFVITGSLEHYGSRNELKEIIEQKGGKVTGSVTSKTDCLINNDIASTSSKNKKAKELNIPIITEEQFRSEYLGIQD